MSDPVRLVLPDAPRSRSLVAALFDSVPGSLEGRDVVVVADGATRPSASFADELVRVTLQEGHADSLVLVRPSMLLLDHVGAAAEDRHVLDRVRLDPLGAAPAPVSV